MNYSRDYKKALTMTQQAEAIKNTVTFDLPSEVFRSLSDGWRKLISESRVIISNSKSMTSNESTVLRAQITFVESLEIKDTFQ